jgi:hypothetical protein
MKLAILKRQNNPFASKQIERDVRWIEKSILKIVLQGMDPEALSVPVSVDDESTVSSAPEKGNHPTASSVAEILVLLEFIAVGSAPRLAKTRSRAHRNDSISKIILWLRSKLKLSESQSLFVYCNEAFRPSLDDSIGDLFDVRTLTKTLSDLLVLWERRVADSELLSERSLGITAFTLSGIMSSKFPVYIVLFPGGIKSLGPNRETSSKPPPVLGVVAFDEAGSLLSVEVAKSKNGFGGSSSLLNFFESCSNSVSSVDTAAFNIFRG